jgi:hypothetical protein
MSDGTILLNGVSTPTDLPSSNQLKFYKVDSSNQLAAIDSAGTVYVFMDGFKNNYAGAVAPTTGDDADDGYGVGSVWVDTVLDDAYMCLDATAAAAVWKQITP